MLARGSLGNPWLFERAAGPARRRADREEILDELDWVIDRAVEHLGASARRATCASSIPGTSSGSALAPPIAQALQAALQTADTRGRARSCFADAAGRADAGPIARLTRIRRRELRACLYSSARGTRSCVTPPLHRRVFFVTNASTYRSYAMPKDVILTPEGLANLKAELEHLSTDRRREVAARIKEAREFGDISENAEYDDAKNEQAMLEARIAQLEEKLRSATVIDADDLGTDVVRVGSVVHVKDEDGKSTKYTIVGSAEANPAEHKLSNESPVGKALLGRKRGEEVVFATPRGERQAEDHQDRRRPARAREPRDWGRPGRGTRRRLRHPPAQARRAARGRRRPVPARVRGVEPIAAVRDAHARPRGRRGDRRRLTASPAAWRRAAARARWRSWTWSTAPGGSSSRRASTCSAPSGMARLLDLDLGDLVGVDGTAFVSRRGELSLRVEAFALLAKSLRPPPDKHHGLKDVETRFRHRELDLIANEEARELFIDARANRVSAVRRFLDDDGLHRGRDAGPAAALRRRRGAAVHDPPQRARPRPLPADRHRAVPQAADRRRPGARLRARQGLPQRGRRHKHNPEFTMLEWYEAYADYEDVAARCEQLVAVRRPPRSATRASSTSRRRGGARRWPARSSTRTGIDVLAHRDRDALAAAMRAARPRRPDRRPRLAAARRRAALQARRADADRADVPARLSRSSCRRSPSATAPRTGWSSASRPSPAGWRSPTPSPSSTTPTSSAAASRSSGALAGGRRRGGAALRRGLRPGARARHAADRRDRHRHRPAGDAADRARSIREVVLFPAMRD